MDPRVAKSIARLRAIIVNIEDRIDALELEEGTGPSPAVRLVLERGLKYQRERLKAARAELAQFEAAQAEEDARQPRLPGT